MAGKSLRVIARIRARPDKVEEMRAMLTGLIRPTRAEPGCVSYELLHNLIEPTDFTFVEEWADDAALDSHFNTEHIRGALARFSELSAEPLDLRKYSVVG